MDRHRLRLLSDVIGAAFLDGEWTSPTALAERAARRFEGRPRWLVGLAERIFQRFPDEAPRDRFEDLSQAIAGDPQIAKATVRATDRLRMRFVESSAIAMATRHPDWNVRRLDTTGDVASWLGLSVADLAWFADTKGFARRARPPKLAHYTCRWVRKRSSSSSQGRLIEAPKRWLKEVQRRVLFEILDRIPKHDAAHGFCRRRSILTHASLHASKRAVLRMDLEDFFPTVRASRVFAIFRAVGYPQEVSRLLTCLCTTISSPSTLSALTPEASASSVTSCLLVGQATEVRSVSSARMRYRERHLPQGAPTSPALANLAAFGLDVRLSAAATARGVTYTRYADDLVFSSDEDHFARSARRFSSLVGGIVLDEGFLVNHRKTRIMQAATRQKVTGLVVNQAPSMPREEYEQLKAILHNCARFGVEAQNRDGHPDFRAHLLGRLAWLRSVQPQRAAKLQRVFDRIVWSGEIGATAHRDRV